MSEPSDLTLSTLGNTARTRRRRQVPGVQLRAHHTFGYKVDPPGGALALGLAQHS